MNKGLRSDKLLAAIWPITTPSERDRWQMTMTPTPGRVKPSTSPISLVLAEHGLQREKRVEDEAMPVTER